MFENAPTASAPEALPVLGRGRHRNPARGACFMEYTSLLAGETFSDSPRCVDTALASVLRGANDTLGDDERPALIPLLGRAIGLVVARSDERPPRSRRLRLRRATGAGEDDAALTARVRRLVSDKFIAAVGLPTSKSSTKWYREYAGVSEIFWDLMSVPTPARAAEDYTGRLVQRLELLHRCYEEAFAELGLPRYAGDPRGPACATPRADRTDAVTAADAPST
jgi:hypothetical protein